MCLLSQYEKKQSFLNPSPGTRDLEVSVFVIPEREGKPYEAACPCPFMFTNGHDFLAVFIDSR